MRKIAILASGSGTNAENIARYFKNSDLASISCIVANKIGAGVKERAERLGIPFYYFSNEEMREATKVLALFESLEIDLIVLAGYLNLIPQAMIRDYPDRIVNIHPALLPKYGGKGMYGHYVHEAVIAAAERESGITIHLVDEAYDRGRIVRQAKCEVFADDNADTLANRIHQLEYEHYPLAIEELLLATNAPKE